MKHRLLKLGLLLLLGAIINVAVAWGCAIVLPHSLQEEVAIATPNSSDDTTEWQHLVQLRAIGCVVHEYQYEFRGAVKVLHNGEVKYTVPQICGDDKPGPIELMYPAKAVSWSRLGFVTVAGRSLLIDSELAAGWPTPALWGCVAGIDMDRRVIVHMSCIGIGGTRKTEHGLDRPVHCLPLGILWPGFAINTVFYAAILWLLLAGPRLAYRRVIRGRLRLKRDLCPSCGYPVGTSPVCTECGVPVTPTSVEPPTP